MQEQRCAAQVRIQPVEVVQAGDHGNAFRHHAAHAGVEIFPLIFHHHVQRDGIFIGLVVLGLPRLEDDAVLPQGFFRGGGHEALFRVRQQPFQNGGSEPFAEDAQVAVEGAFHPADRLVASGFAGQGSEQESQLEMGRIETVGGFPVHHAGGVSVRKIGHHLFRGALGRLRVGLPGVGAQVGKDEVRHGGGRFFSWRVLGVDVRQVADVFARGLGGGQRFFIHHAVAGAIDEHRAVLHAVDKFRVHHVVGGGTARNVQGDDVALGEDVFNAGGGDADVQGALAGQKVVVAQQGGFKSLEALDEVAADVAQADDAHGFFGQLAAHVFFLFPQAFPGGGVRLDDVAVIRQNHGHDFLRHGVGVGAGGVHDVHILLAGVHDVNVVVAGSGADDQLQGGEGVHDCRSDFFTADDQGHGVRMGGGLFFQRRVGVLDDFIAGRFKRIGRYVGEFGGNKNLVHVGMVENVIVQWYGQKVRCAAWAQTTWTWGA